METMIDTALKLIDRFVELKKIPKEIKREQFINIIDPIYQDASIVADDYFKLFSELLGKIEAADDVQEIILWLEQRRLEFAKVRISLRVHAKNVDPLSTDSEPDSIERFRLGVLDIMRGGLSTVETGHFMPVLKQEERMPFRDHTVLDLMWMWSDQPMLDNQHRYIQAVRFQLSCVETAWANVEKGYSEIKQQLLR